MITPLKKSFQRLATDIDQLRPALADRIQNDKALSAQKPMLQNVDDKLLDLHDDILSVLTVWNIADAKNQENEEILSTTMNRLTDDATLVGGTEVYILEPGGIKYVLTNASERNAKIAINSIPQEIRGALRAQWCKWWGCTKYGGAALNDDNN